MGCREAWATNLHRLGREVHAGDRDAIGEGGGGGALHDQDLAGGGADGGGGPAVRAHSWCRGRHHPLCLPHHVPTMIA